MSLDAQAVTNYSLMDLTWYVRSRVSSRWCRLPQVFEKIASSTEESQYKDEQSHDSAYL